MLEEQGNFHSKTIKSLKKKMKTMTKLLKDMAAQIKDFQSKPKPPSPMSELRRCNFTSLGARKERVDPPRASSFKPWEVIS
ncbi:unnamed protein product [Arabidopsis thaliana]|uniref:Uncharacterized protein n=1 Tax=Arabidopsis thaliana TaxID=3702 RepID=A0A654EFR1_ARATH|nr:unnamed protein product [Arabidopsis thaliana]